MESVQDGDGFGQFVTDGFGVAAERIQLCRLDPGGERGPRSLIQSACAFPNRSVRNKVQQSGVHVRLLIAGVYQSW